MNSHFGRVFFLSASTPLSYKFAAAQTCEFWHHWSGFSSSFPSPWGKPPCASGYILNHTPRLQFKSFQTPKAETLGDTAGHLLFWKLWQCVLFFPPNCGVTFLFWNLLGAVSLLKPWCCVLFSKLWLYVLLLNLRGGVLFWKHWVVFYWGHALFCTLGSCVLFWHLCCCVVAESWLADSITDAVTEPR